MKSILLLAANPKGTRSLRLQEEEQEIKERLRLAGYGKIPINSVGAVRPKDIHQAMLDWKPQVVHFSGHGAGKEGLVFEDGTGQEKLVDSEALANLFRLFTRQYPIECVVLNACYSEFQAQAIARHVDYVIGMSQAIGDRAAIEFSVGFYKALGTGESFKFAYELGCIAIELEGIPEYLTPILWEKGQLIDTGQNNLTPRTQVPNPRRQEEAERQQPPQQPTPKIPSKSQEETDELASEKSVDYTKLRDLLAPGNWKKLESKQVAPVSTPQPVQPSPPQREWNLARGRGIWGVVGAIATLLGAMVTFYVAQPNGNAPRPGDSPSPSPSVTPITPDASIQSPIIPSGYVTGKPGECPYEGQVWSPGGWCGPPGVCPSGRTWTEVHGNCLY